MHAYIENQSSLPPCYFKSINNDNTVVRRSLTNDLKKKQNELVLRVRPHFL